MRVSSVCWLIYCSIHCLQFSRSKEVKNGVDSEGGSEVSGVHVYAERGAEINLVHNEDSHEEDNASQNEMVTIETSNPPPVVSMDYSRKETLKVCTCMSE